MRLLSLDRPRLFLVTALLTSSLLLWPASAQDQPNTAKTKSASCSNDDSRLKLPAGFCATVFADGIGHARHIAVASNGVVYVNTWSGEDYGPAKPPAGGFLVALQDKTGTGKADVIERFGETVQSGGAGGTGIGIYKGAIYAEINDRIVRYSHHRVRRVAIYCDDARPRMTRSLQGSLEELLGRSRVSLSGKPEVDRGAGGIDSTIQVPPAPTLANVRFVDPPGAVGWFQFPPAPLVQFGCVALHPKRV